MANSFGNIIIPCPVTPGPSNPPYGTLLYQSCSYSSYYGNNTIQDHYADGNGGEYIDDTGLAC